MAKVKATPYSEYDDKKSWGEPFDSIDPDTPPHTLPPVTLGKFSKEYMHRRWFCAQYFGRRGYIITRNMPGPILFSLRIARNGGLVDATGLLRVPANSHNAYATNYVMFQWERRRARWKKDAFVVDGKANKTITDLFEAAITKANRVIVPYDIKFDKRMKLLSFRRWLFEYSRGKVDYRNDTWKIAKSFSLVKLADAPARMTITRVTLASVIYPFVLKDKVTFNDKFQRDKRSEDFAGVCFAIAYGKLEESFRLERISNFFCWHPIRKVYGWARYLAVEPYAPSLPSNQSQQVFRSFPVYIGKRDKPARSMTETYGSTNYYGMLNVIVVRGLVFIHRDLSYPARTFTYCDNLEVEFTDEDREWNVADVFDHRTWDPYEINNWTVTPLVASIRKKNNEYVRTKIIDLLDNDPTFLERSASLRPLTHQSKGKADYDGNVQILQ